MAWTDILKRLKISRDADDDMDDEKLYGEGGPMERTASDPDKAELFRVRMDKRTHEGPESEKRYAKSADYEIEKESIDDKVAKRRAVAFTRDLKPGATSEDAMNAIEKAGGLEKYWESMSMADESERKAFEKKLRRYLDGLDDNEDDEILGTPGTINSYPIKVGVHGAPARMNIEKIRRELDRAE